MVLSRILTFVERLSGSRRDLRIRASLLTAVTFVFMAAFMSSPAQSALVEAEAFYAMTAYGQLTVPGEPAAIQNLGVHGARMTIDWGVVEPAGECGARETVAPRWETIDARFEVAATHGITILPNLGGTRVPDVAETPETPGCRHIDIPLAGTRLFNDFVDREGFVGRVVRRYGRGGTFWTEHRSLPERPARVWEIWNEPNYSIYHQRERTNPQAYAKLLIEAAKTIHREGEANTKVLLGGINPSGEPRFMDIRQFVRKMYEPISINGLTYTVSELNAEYDGMAYHPYRLASPPSAVKAAVRRAHSVLKQNRAGDKTLWITEVGWPTFNVPAAGEAPATNISQHKQANYLWGTLRWLHNHSNEREAEELRIKYVAWFVYQDRAEPSGELCRVWSCWEHVSGLRTPEGADKESWCAYSRLTGAGLSCAYTAPAATRADKPTASASNGSPGAVSVRGGVTLSETPEEHLNGVSAELVFEKWSAAEEEWLDDSTTAVTILNDRYDVADHALGAGLWRVRLDLPYNELYEETESSYSTFEIAAGYQIVARHTRECLDVELPAQLNRTFVVQKPCGDPVRNQSQIWRLVPMGGGQYEITNLVSGRCLDVQGVDLLPGARVWLYDCDRSGLLQNQVWRPETTTGLSDPYVHLRVQHSSQCLEVLGASRVSGAFVGQNPCLEPALTYPAQAWKLVAAEVQELTPGRLVAEALIIPPERTSGLINLTNTGEHYIESDWDLTQIPGFSLASQGNCRHLAPGETCQIIPNILAGTPRPATTLARITYTSLGRQYVLTSEVRAEAGGWLTVTPSPAGIAPEETETRITLRNEGSAAIEARAELFLITTFPYTVPAECLRIAIRGSCAVTVRAGTVRRPATGTFNLSYRTNGRERAISNSIVSSNTAPGRLVATPVPAIIPPEDTRVGITLRNTGASAIEADLRVSGTFQSNGFERWTIPCQTVAAGGSCIVTAQMGPTQRRPLSGGFTLNYRSLGRDYSVRDEISAR